MLRQEEIIEALAPLNLWGKPQVEVIERPEYIKILRQFLKNKELAAAVIGVRRSGKTFLTKQILREASLALAPENTLYVLLEDPKFEPYLKPALLEAIYQAYRNNVNPQGKAYLVLDEVQNIPFWEKWVRTLLEKNEPVEVIVTGSSSKLLQSSLATALTGRVFTCCVFPLTFLEFLKFKGSNNIKKYEIIAKRKQWEKMFNDYLTFGGFPQAVLMSDENLKNQYLKELFEGIIYRDVAARHKVKDMTLIKIIAELATNNFSCLISATKLRKILVAITGRKISPNFVLQTLGYLEEAFLIYQIPIFSYKVKEQKLYPKKIYCIDTGLINAVTLKFSANIGRLYENITAINLIKQYGRENVFYWKSPEQEEVDFAIKQGLRIQRLCQVCYNLDEAVLKREKRSLLKAAAELNCHNLTIITKDFAKKETIGKYKIIYEPLWQFLLSQLEFEEKL
ncbi:ATP-binding protein [Candidatus Saganbacteria bacterium]|nr:ATP-binding protein [Candidatus Saganbacteria bacterium]